MLHLKDLNIKLEQKEIVKKCKKLNFENIMIS